MNNNNNSFYFVRKGRSFDDGKAQRRGFESNANVTIYIKNKEGKIISSGANVTFYYPGITDVAIDGVIMPAISSGSGWIKVNIGTGNHDVLLLTDGEVPPDPDPDPDPDPPIPTCASQSGTCCSAEQTCQGVGSSSVSSSDCSNVCCVGGTCEDPAPTCQTEGYYCCASCESGSK